MVLQVGRVRVDQYVVRALGLYPSMWKWIVSKPGGERVRGAGLSTSYSINSCVNQDVGEVKSPCYLTACVGYSPIAVIKYPGVKGILRRTWFILYYSF